MIYLDTSFIAPLIIAESGSEQAENLISKSKPGDLATSLWTQVEFAGLLARKVLIGELTRQQAASVRNEFRTMLNETFRVIVPTATDFDTARDYLEVPKTGLRSGDALHLAIAANRNVKKIWSLDQGFIKAGKLLNLPVSAGR